MLGIDKTVCLVFRCASVGENAIEQFDVAENEDMI